ncbi:MAG: C-GCAxxG-C-C family (seleno)protein [Bacillota bacterium]|nr:C-GCAxxG-C-C family (seleno)protein [Bacillota bacterium]HHT89378.1 twin-arginine translocation signal domain-containing protein [Bacillota bacterium]
MEEKKKVLTRRDFLVSAGGAAAGLALAGTGLGLFAPKAEGATIDLPEYPWEQYFDKPLDVEKVRELGAQYYGEGNGCAEGAFRALVEVLGEPFNYVPSQVMNFGKGGGVAWGTLCGAVNGAAAAVSLVYGRGQGTAVIVNELMAWYSATALPLNTTESSVAGNPLCHASIANWCKATGKKSSERGPRCKALTGDVAAQAALYMNQLQAGTFVPAFPMSEETKACFDCHVGGMADDTLGKMDCSGCHEGH